MVWNDSRFAFGRTYKHKKPEWIGTELEFCGNPLFYYQNALNWPRWNSLLVCNFIYSDSSVLDDSFLHSTHVFFCFVCWRASQAFGIFNVGQIAFDLHKLLEHLCPSHYPFFEIYFHHFRSVSNIFPRQYLRIANWTRHTFNWQDTALLSHMV